MQGESIPCPFCGGKRTKHARHCYIRVAANWNSTAQEVIAAWDRRATDGQRDTARGVPERLRKYVEYRRKTQMRGLDEVIHSVNGVAELCLSDLYALLAAAPTPQDGDAAYVEVAVRIGDAVARRVATREEFEKSHYPRQMAHYQAIHAVDAAMAASKGEKG